jgi:hypothetical protein
LTVAYLKYQNDSVGLSRELGISNVSSLTLAYYHKEDTLILVQQYFVTELERLVFFRNTPNEKVWFSTRISKPRAIYASSKKLFAKQDTTIIIGHDSVINVLIKDKNVWRNGTPNGMIRLISAQAQIDPFVHTPIDVIAIGKHGFNWRTPVRDCKNQ